MEQKAAFDDDFRRWVVMMADGDKNKKKNVCQKGKKSIIFFILFHPPSLDSP